MFWRGFFVVPGRWFLLFVFPALLPLITAGCHTTAESVALGVAGGMVAGAQSPASEIEEVYYVGVFDPDEQLPPSIYRIRVHGQSAILNSVRFATGWVPASMIDTLTTHVNLDPNENSAVSITGVSTNQTTPLSMGRRMWLFGPEGFREAPVDQRLVIVMSSDPSQFFEAIDETLGLAATAAATTSAQTSSSATQASLLAAYKGLLNSREQLEDVKVKQSSLKP